MTDTQGEIKYRVRVVVALIFCLALYLFGLALLFIYAGVEVSLAVFLLLWANNIGTKKD